MFIGTRQETYVFLRLNVNHKILRLAAFLAEAELSVIINLNGVRLKPDLRHIDNFQPFALCAGYLARHVNKMFNSRFRMAGGQQ